LQLRPYNSPFFGNPPWDGGFPSRGVTRYTRRTCMYTSILLVALTGMAPAAEGSKAPAWSHDYSAAGKEAVQAKKPLLVILAPGQDGYDRMGREGGLSAEARALLAEKYVCVHVDTTTARGKELARAFEFDGDMGIAISDVTGDKLAFYHEGDLANA